MHIFRDVRIHVFVTAEVAQLVEHLVVAQVAVGSSPIFRPTNFPRQHTPRRGFFYGAWRSLVAHLLWEQGVASSSPAAPTIWLSSSVG